MYLYSTRLRDSNSKSDAEEFSSTQERRYLCGQAYKMASQRHDFCLMCSPDNGVRMLQSSLDTTQGFIDLCDFDVHQDIDRLAFLRITITKAFIRPLYAAIFLLAVSNIVLNLLWIFQCTPHLDKAWNPKMPGMCFPKGQLERIIISQAS